MKQGSSEVMKKRRRDEEVLIREMKGGCTGMKRGCRVEKGEEEEWKNGIEAERR
jgi:hypothetical protein